MSGNGWQTVTRKKAAKRSPEKARSTIKVDRHYFPQEFEDVSELDVLGVVAASRHPAPAQPRRMDEEATAALQAAIVEFFRDGYRTHFGAATNEQILTFINNFLQEHRILISGGFVLKNMVPFQAGATRSIDMDIYIPHDANEPVIQDTLQKLFNVEKKANGTPVMKRFVVRTGSRAPKASFFQKNGIQAVTKYERNLSTVQAGGGISAANILAAVAAGAAAGAAPPPTSSETRRKQAAQTDLVAAATAGDAAGVRDAAARGGVIYIDMPADVLAGNPNLAVIQAMYEISGVRSWMIPLTFLNSVVRLPLPEAELLPIVRYIAKRRVNLSEPPETPLEIALNRDYAQIVELLLRAGADPLAPSATHGQPILEAARAGQYPAAARAALLAHEEDVEGLARSGSSASEGRYGKKFIATRPAREATLAEARAAFTEPICSTEGTYQHIGECWNDASHMLMLYSDGISEYTQSPLLMDDLNVLAARIKDGTHVSNNRAKAMRVYLEATRARFARQILNQAETEAQCTADVIGVRRGTRRAGGINSMAAAVMGAIPHLGFGYAHPERITSADYIRQGHFEDQMITQLIRVFGLEALLRVARFSRAVIPSLPPYEFTEPIGSTIGIALATHGDTGNHATCFYTCRGIDYFFDNNIGVFQYPWRKLISAGARMTIVTIKQGGDIITRHWPAFHLRDKLIIPTMKGEKRFYTVAWDGVSPKKWPVGNITTEYVQRTGLINATTLLWQPGAAPQPVNRVAPVVVGRGDYRAAYRPSASSSERRAFNGIFEKAEMDVVQASSRSSPMRIIRNFDLTFCQNWYDGEHLWSMDPEAVFRRAPGTLEPSYVPIYRSGNSVTRKRILKYIRRGFRVQYRDPNSRRLIEITRADLADVDTP
jgi:hypothetical protein